MIIVLGYSFTRGFYTASAFWVLFFSLFVFLLYFLKPNLFSLINTIPLRVCLSLVLIVSLILSLHFYGGLYQEKGAMFQNSVYLLAFSLFVSTRYLIEDKFLPKLLRSYSFPLLLSIGIALQVLMIISSPKPAIDVFYQLKDGSFDLLRGINPYTHVFPQIYNYPQDYFPYLPLTAIVVLPFKLLLFDPRFTLISANLLVVFIFRKILKKSGGTLAHELIPLIYLFHPQMTFMIEQAWIDPVIFAAFCLFTYSIIRNLNKYISILSLAITIGMKQHFVVIVVFLFFFRKVPKKIIYMSILLVLVITIPFYFWSPEHFVKDVITNHIDRRFWWHNSLTFNSFFFSEFKTDVNTLFFIIIWILLLYFILKKGLRNFPNLTLAICLWFFAFYLFNYQAYIHYYFFVSELILLSIALSQTTQSYQKI